MDYYKYTHIDGCSTSLRSKITFKKIFSSPFFINKKSKYQEEEEEEEEIHFLSAEKIKSMASTFRLSISFLTLLLFSLVCLSLPIYC